MSTEISTFTSQMSTLATEISTFVSTFNSNAQKIKPVCDIIPPITSLPVILVNLPMYIVLLITAPIRYPLCLLIAGISNLDCPQCVIYNLFPFLSVINLFEPTTQQCTLFGCTCGTSTSPCGPTSLNAYSNTSLQQAFSCNGNPCPNSYLNTVSCILAYAFLSPLSPIFTLANVVLNYFFDKQIYFSFNCPLPSG